MTIDPHPWEVWWADVAFEDAPHIRKRRPVVVLDHQNAIVLSLKVTSHTPRSQFAGEYALAYWQEAGLSKPSTVRITKLLRLRETDFA